MYVCARRDDTVVKRHHAELRIQGVEVSTVELAELRMHEDRPRQSGQGWPA